ncbi:MAG TPA: sterol desaturase family protein [Candidatus Poseidoniales archaeon]|nr:MAG: fatty acid hydroxylase family protein [Euryarchaeota archaeon]HIF89994.1 sterol desaturase family protein [Candidatus Poseidoniales archaeon]
MIFLMMVEAFYQQQKTKQQSPWSDMMFNLNSGHVLMWALRGVEFIVYGYILTYYSLELLPEMPYWLLFIIAFICWDFGHYCFHYMHHKFKWLWMIHVVHHEGIEFNLSLGLRNSWLSPLTSMPFFFFLAIIGVPLEIFILVGSIHYGVQYYNHIGVVKQSGFLEHIMVTPSAHKVHHGIQDLYKDTNFGSVLNIWDRIFGTFQREQLDIPVQLGVIEPLGTENIFWANIIPIAERFGIKIKVPNYGLKRASDRQIVINGLLIFGVFLQYLIIEHDSNLLLKGLIFAIGFTGTIGLGFITEGHVWGYRLNLICSSLLIGTYFYSIGNSISSLELNLVLVLVSNLTLLYFSPIQQDIKAMPFSTDATNLTVS